MTNATPTALTDSAGDTTQRTGLRYAALAMPLVIVILGYACFTARTTYLRLTRPWPTSALEVEFVMDAWRSIHGDPVYTNPAIDHATHMYGPLITYTTVPLVNEFGPDLRPPRYVSLAATVMLCLIAGAILVRNGGWFAGFLAIFLCYFQFFRLREWATGSRPDAHALLLALVAMILFYRGWKATNLSRATMWTLIGTAVMVLGFFFKQTAATVALVPPVILLVQRPQDLAKRLAISSIPFAATAGIIVLLRVGWPWIYFYMITVPAKYSVNWSVWALGMLELVRFNTLFIAALIGWAVIRLRGREQDGIDLWLMTAIVVLSVPSAIARAKWGGSYNSYLPVYIPMSLFAARSIPLLFREAAAQRWPALYAWLIAIALAGLPIVDITSTVRTLNPGAIALEHGGPNYLKVIDMARDLPGTFISPDDPTIALRATDYVGRTAAIELDANLHVVPSYLLDDISSADWVLQVARGWPSSLPDAELEKLGFEKTSGVIPADAVYTLWKRSASTTQPN